MNHINFCKVFEDMLGDYTDGSLDPMLATECNEHTRSCPKCALLKAEYQVTIELASQLKSAKITNDIRMRLRDRLEENTGIRFAMN